MSKILLSEPDGPYRCTVDTHVMKVEVHECFNGILFVTESGEKLGISMRDNGFEVHYFREFDEEKFDHGWVDFKNGIVERRGHNGS